MAQDFLTTLFAYAARDLLRMRMSEERPAPNPAAGADFRINAQGGVIWEVLSFRASMTTSAVVANRQVALGIFDQDGTRIAMFPAVSNQTATQTQGYTFYAGQGAWEAFGEQTAPLPVPPALVQPGWSIRTVTTAIDVGDQWSAGVLTVRSWDETEIAQEVESMNELFDSVFAPRLGY